MTSHLSKILFLDIDGVVNKQENFDRSKGLGPYPIDSYCAFLVGRIQIHTNCSVVLSSSWRHHPDGVKAVKEKIVDIIDITPYLPGKRGDEIRAWLAEHPEVKKYAILDDDSDFYQDQPLFKTSFTSGLTDSIAENVIEYLGRD